MRCRAVYTVRTLRLAEQRLIREAFCEEKQRIFPQQWEDGFPTFRHYGLELSDGTVIHFSGKLQCIHADAWIQRTSGAIFCKDGCIYPAYDVRMNYSPEEVAQRALCQVGGTFGGYHFLRNNCEHFVNWCANGRRISRQVLFRIFEGEDEYS